MRLSGEQRRVRWSLMGGVWLLVGLLLALHTAAVGAHLALVAQRGTRNNAPPSTPMRSAYLPGTADGLLWVRHAKSLLDGNGPQLRHTDIDNAPSGRDVHWNSAWAWAIAGAARVDQRVTGNTIERSLERITIWLSPLTLFALIVLISAFTARRAGAAAGAFVAIGMVGHDYFFSTFIPSYVDHHGLLSASVFGLVLGAVFMGAGWWRSDADPSAGTGRLFPDSQSATRSAAIVSALSGALGMWVSAASVIPAIAIIGVAGAACALVCGRAAIKSGAQFDARAWRIWGRVGAAASLFFYALEYFPGHLSLHLEANHPLYSLAWWGAGELIAEFTERRVRPTAPRINAAARIAMPAAAILLAPVIMLFAGASVFAPMGPFLSQLHSSFIIEFQPLWQGFDALTWNPYTSVVGIENAPLLAGAWLLATHRERTNPIVALATMAVFAFTTMAWMQNRWIANASGAQIALALVLVVYFVGDRATRARWYGTALASTLLFVPGIAIRQLSARSDVRDEHIDRSEQVALLYRDIAAAIRESQPVGDITLLTSPNASSWVGYYGQMRTVGTLYWENAAGLRAAAEIFSAHTSDEAAQRIRERGITHVAMISEVDFLGPYYQLLHGRDNTDSIGRSFGYRLLYESEVPPWLQMIPYHAPPDLRGLGIRVLLFKVAFDQSPDEWLHHMALGAVALGELDKAEHLFDALIERSPRAHHAWLGKGGVLFAKQEWNRAAETALAGIALAPQRDRAALYEWLMNNFLRSQQPAHALRVIRAALADQFNPNLASTAAFMLATSTDERLRNGTEAVALAKRAVAAQPETPTYQLCLAAALAETRLFPEAIRTAERAAGLARETRDVRTLQMAERMLIEFRAGRAWRE